MPFYVWYEEDGMDPSEITELLRRDKSSMTRLLVAQKASAHTIAHSNCRIASCPFVSAPRVSFTMWAIE